MVGTTGGAGASASGADGAKSPVHSDVTAVVATAGAATAVPPRTGDGTANVPSGWASKNDAPVVIDFTVGKDAMVWPMVAAGTSNDEIMFARDVRPEFEEDDL